MKVTLDLDQLLSDGKIDQAEYEKFRLLAAKSTNSLAFNILIGFGVVAVSGAVLALVPAPATAILIGALILVAGLALLRSSREQWMVLSNIFVLVGALSKGYAEHRVFFASEQDAIQAGYRPCGRCMVSQYKEWKSGPEGKKNYPWKILPK